MIGVVITPGAVWRDAAPLGVISTESDSKRSRASATASSARISRVSDCDAAFADGEFPPLIDCRRDDRWQLSASGRLRPEVLTCEAQWEAVMDPLEGQARAIIAAALIVRGAVEVPAIPTGTERVPDAGGCGCASSRTTCIGCSRQISRRNPSKKGSVLQKSSETVLDRIEWGLLLF